MSEYAEWNFEVRKNRVCIQWSPTSWLFGVHWSSDIIDRQIGVSFGPLMATVEWEIVG